jgi:hypothetical protein
MMKTTKTMVEYAVSYLLIRHFFDLRCLILAHPFSRPFLTSRFTTASAYWIFGWLLHVTRAARLLAVTPLPNCDSDGGLGIHIWECGSNGTDSRHGSNGRE